MAWGWAGLGLGLPGLGKPKDTPVAGHDQSRGRSEDCKSLGEERLRDLPGRFENIQHDAHKQVKNPLKMYLSSSDFLPGFGALLFSHTSAIMHFTSPLLRG